MSSAVWDLEAKPDYHKSARDKWLQERGFNKGYNDKFKVGDVIEFYTGINDHIRARAKIKGIDGVNLYVYFDSYWYPIQDDEVRKIKKIS